MYRWLLCWRYLRTRYIALASVVSVTLGVATLIVVNSVMDGFTSEMQGRMHGILSDVIVESHSADGITNHRLMQQEIRQILGDDLIGLTTVVHIPAMVTIRHRGEPITRQINLIGIDTDSYSSVSDFSKYLLHPDNQKQLSFFLQETGYAPGRKDFPLSGWQYRRSKAAREKQLIDLLEKQKLRNAEQEQQNAYLRQQLGAVLDQSAGTENAGNSTVLNASGTQEADLPDHGLSFPPPLIDDSQMRQASLEQNNGGTGPSLDAMLTLEEQQASVFDPEIDQHDGIVLGISIGSTRWRNPDGEVCDYYYVQPGDDVSLTFPTSGENPKAANLNFTVVDFYESQMSEYDATFAFVPLDRLQHARGMGDAVSSIQLKLRPGTDLDAVRDTLRGSKILEDPTINVNTWRDLQGALLAAVEMETTILNILLFLIIAVAGFGILATFFMIVVEKTKDIGVLKSLGANGLGVATIFLGYGVLLGTLGSGVGAVAGLLFVANINSIADLLESVTGREVFDPTVYYFETIPTIVHPAMVVWVVLGAIAIAVVASVLPSIRAARMHPVEALRYE